MDSEGGIWTCRWASGKILRLTPDGEIDVEIDFPTAWHITCCVFGGKSSTWHRVSSDAHPPLGENLDELYVTSAASDYIGDNLPDRKNGGDLFVVKGLGIKGVERGRFKGSIPK